MLNKNTELPQVGFYDSVENEDYTMNVMTLIKQSSGTVFDSIIRKNNIAIFSDPDKKIGYALNYKTDEIWEIFNGTYCSTYGDKIIYKSNDTYKLIDSNGNDCLDARYFEFFQNGVANISMLKREDGSWICVNEQGDIIENKFSGGDNCPNLYENEKIECYIHYDGIPCVIVDGEDNWVGYSLLQ